MNKIMGLDLGSKTCGVALSDSLQMIATGKETIRFEEDDYQSALKKACEIIKENKVETVVLGLPKHMNGDEGIRADISKKFKEMLEQAVDVKVILWDERLTTVSAQKSMIASNMNRVKRHKMIDTMAAVIILQSYLDAKSQERNTMDDNILFITTDDGKEMKMEQLFNFYSDQYKKSYVLYIDPQSDDGQVYAMSFDEDKNLFAVETDEEWEMIEEVFEAWIDEQQED